MQLPVYLFRFGFVLLALVACGDNGTPPEVDPPEVDPPVVNPPVVTPPEGPYEYDDDLDYDSEAFLKAYKGILYKGAHHIPGTLEAEDFDEGAQNVAYYESDTKPADAGYRGAHAVDVRADGNASGGYYIGDVQPGEWMCYTIEVDEDGAYSIDTYCVKGDGSEGSFYFEVDGRGASRGIAMPLGGWTDFSHKATAEDIQLTKGKHVLKYFGSTPGNIDKFVFRRTGKLEELSSSFTYPVTKSMSNPLFTGFDSPMYNSWLKGPLYTADASAHVWNINGKEVLYVYASHVMEPALGCDRMDRYHVFSTEDMVNWTDHGEIMNAATVRLHAGWGCDGFMWAPDCVYNPADQTYYFYFPHPSNAANWNKTWRVGVATSKYPDKEFRVVAYVEGMPAEIDPCVFIDDDGQAYIYWGNGRMYMAKLTDDMMSIDGEIHTITPSNFREGAFVIKRNGIYYFMWSDNDTGEPTYEVRYGTSNSPYGPIQGNTRILTYSNTDDSRIRGTGHHSVINVPGTDDWYICYHRFNVPRYGTVTSKNSEAGNHREICIEKMEFDENGNIKPVTATLKGITEPVTIER